ncbi:MAG: CotS family spore coat protein [Clostridium sp.]|uniref:CotS family spore coat protein n=1 Tax=Clostridium sp. TaxID=1506 RepID=UPI00290B4536|nr:CotS family spore coat protein [Clostridium sp.]MDU5109984.1 CotS family spore coat protein [Clostridium sp.]
MEISYIKNEIQDKYLLEIESIEKVKNSYKISTKGEEYGIKVIKYQKPHFYFIFSAINHLINRGFNKIPEIIKTKDNEGYIRIGNNYAYLNKWIEARNSNYNDIDDLRLVSRTLAELHNCSEGFTLDENMNPRIAWFSWIKVFETRCEEILDFRKRIYQKAYKSDFDKIYLAEIDKEINRGRKAIESLLSNNYFGVMEKKVFKRGFCHHDFAYHNVLINSKGEANIIDFDYCILDSNIHDVASLLIRTMKDGKWNRKRAEYIIDNYSECHYLNKEEFRLMKGFIMFPQGFWQIGLQYYWEQQPWGEEFLMNRLNKYLRDREEREDFLEDFFNER